MSGRACTVCGEELPAEIGCTATLVQIEGRDCPVVPHGDTDPCVECGAPEGGNHHGECPLELCPACRGYLVDCGCAALPATTTKERIEWTIDENEIATLSDEDACSAIDGLVEPLVQKIEDVAARAGAGGLDPGLLRYQLARTILIEMIRRLVWERAEAAEKSGSSGKSA